MDRAHRVVGSHRLSDHKVKGDIVRVLLGLNEVGNVRDAIKLSIEIIMDVIRLSRSEVFDKGGACCHAHVDKKHLGREFGGVDLAIAVV